MGEGQTEELRQTEKWFGQRWNGQTGRDDLPDVGLDLIQRGVIANRDNPPGLTSSNLLVLRVDAPVKSSDSLSNRFRRCLGVERLACCEAAHGEERSQVEEVAESSGQVEGCRQAAACIARMRSLPS